MSRAQTVGWAPLTFGKSPLDDVERLIASDAAPAIDHAGICATDIDGLFVGAINKGFSGRIFQAMGLAAPGVGYGVVRDGVALKDGRLPVNPSGGPKSKGRRIGATGVSMQLMGKAGEMHVAAPLPAGVFNMGGAAVASYVSILERLR